MHLEEFLNTVKAFRCLYASAGEHPILPSMNGPKLRGQVQPHSPDSYSHDVKGPVKRLKIFSFRFRRLREINKWSYLVTHSVVSLPLPRTVA